MAEHHSPLQTATLVRDALQSLVAALRTPDVDRLLAGEAALESAIRSLPADGGDPGEIRVEDALAIRGTVAEARLALLRSRRLGASLVCEVRKSLGQTDVVYGAGLQPVPTGRVLNARG